MKAERIKQLIVDKLGIEVWSSNRRTFGLCLQVRGDWDKGCEEAAAEILELCDADKYDALQVQDAAWHDIEDKHLATLATAQALVAVMAEAFDLALIPIVSEEKKLSVNIAEYGLTSSLDAWREQTLSELETRKVALVEAQDAVMNALSAAPKVV